MNLVLNHHFSFYIQLSDFRDFYNHPFQSSNQHIFEMHFTKAAVTVAAVASTAFAAPTNGKTVTAPARRETNEFGPYPVDNYKEKRDSIWIGDHPGDDESPDIGYA